MNLYFCVNYSRHFSETNKKAIDEMWYKRAIDQHNIEPESFVFSVPFNSGYISFVYFYLVLTTSIKNNPIVVFRFFQIFFVYVKSYTIICLFVISLWIFNQF